MVRLLYARLILFNFLLLGVAGFVFWLLAIYFDLPEALSIGLVAGVGWLLSSVVIGLLLHPIEQILQSVRLTVAGELTPVPSLRGPDGATWMELLRALQGFSAGSSQPVGHLMVTDWQSVLNSLSEGVMLTTPSGQPVWANFALRGMAHDAEAADGRDRDVDFDRAFHARVFVPEQLALIEEEMVRFPERPRTDIIQLERPRQFIRRYSAPLQGGGGSLAGFLVSYQDITHEVEQDRLRQDFIANASHELRTPVTSVKVLLENLVDGAKDDPSVRDEFLNDALREIDRMRELVNDLLDVAALEAGRERLNVGLIDVNPLLRDAVETVSPLAKQRDVSLAVAEANVPVQIEGDRARLRQVLVNLVANATKFTPAGGQVVVRAILDAEAGRLNLEIADTGIGIPAKDLPHIFDRFFRVTRGRSRLQGGSGLGLTIVKQAVDAHCGDIHVESTEGQGTTVFVSLPLRQVGLGDSSGREV